MILKPGVWTGRGSWRIITESTGTRYTALVIIEETQQGIAVSVELETITENRFKYDVWIVPDESGLYTVNATGPGLDVSGTAKLESLPHLGLLSSANGDAHLAVTVFELREVNGARGFYKKGDHTFTFEIALRQRRETAVADNIIAFEPHRRRR